MYLLINSFFPFVCCKQSLSREPHLIAGIPVLWKRVYHVFSSNNTHVFQGQGKQYPRFQGEPPFSPSIRVPCSFCYEITKLQFSIFSSVSFESRISLVLSRPAHPNFHSLFCRPLWVFVCFYVIFPIKNKKIDHLFNLATSVENYLRI